MCSIAAEERRVEGNKLHGQASQGTLLHIIYMKNNLFMKNFHLSEGLILAVKQGSILGIRRISKTKIIYLFSAENDIFWKKMVHLYIRKSNFITYYIAIYLIALIFNPI